MENFARSHIIGTIDTGHRARAKVQIDISYVDGRLSIVGEARRSGVRDCSGVRDRYRGGQMHATIASAAQAGEIWYLSGWDRQSVLILTALWDRWHLNDMRPGCEHQRAAEWDKRPIDPSKPLDSYGLHYEGQQHASWNTLAWVRGDEHPNGLLSRACGTCGYRFGSEWLTEDIPNNVLVMLAMLPL